MSTLYAHSQNKKGNWHELSSHLLYTAELSESFAKKLGIEGFGYAIGLNHDLGKAHPDFQSYLESPNMPRGFRDHSTAGAVHLSKERLGFIASAIIAGHHAGLSDLGDLKIRLKNGLGNAEIQRAIQIGINQLGLNTSFPQIPKGLVAEAMSNPFASEMLIRMLFSCLVDADYLDTEKHFSPERTLARKHSTTTPQSLFSMLDSKRPKGGESALNKEREYVFGRCVEAANRRAGIYKLNVPTGYGKTITGMAMGLALQKERVIVVVPYTSIIEQNAEVYRDMFGADVVLEHHSSVVFKDEEEESRWKLGSENWDVPVIVTTTVQFFESLFGNRPSACRKLHNIANSTVIVDEFQSLPSEVIKPCFQMLDELVKRYGVTVILSSATPLSLGVSLKEHEIVDVLADWKPTVPPRVEYEVRLDKPMTWDEVATEMSDHHQALVIVNKRKDAQLLFTKVCENANPNEVFHLSASMCAEHRGRVLKQVRERLSKKQRVLLVSTQVIEAGVDIDFPFVMRALGPLDRIVQSAGRCNREGKLERGRVVIFKTVDNGFLMGSYGTATSLAESYLKRGINLNDSSVFEQYFGELYDGNMANTDKYAITKLTPLSFKTKSEKFQMISSSNKTIVIPYDDKAKSLIKDLKDPSLAKKTLKALQRYTVSIPKAPTGKFEPIDGFENLYLPLETYDEKFGINFL